MLCCMRTTIRIDDRLLAEAEARAVRSGRTLSAVVEDALRETFARRPALDRAPRPELPVFRGSRLVPGADLDDGAAMLDLMERSDP